MFRFGPGALFATPTQDATGAAIAVPTPVKIGTLQTFSLDYNRDLKELYGENALPVDVAGGKQKLMGKFTTANVNGLLMATLVFGQPMTSAQGFYVSRDLASVVPANPYQITAAPPAAGTFLFDLGVIDAAGVPMLKVTGTPTTGQYAVTAGGQYTFAAADVGKAVYYSYQYSVTTAGSKQIVLVNPLLGNLPTTRLDYASSYRGKNVTLTLPNVVVGKASIIGSKIDDYDNLDLDYQAFADPVTNTALRLALTE